MDSRLRDFIAKGGEQVEGHDEKFPPGQSSSRPPMPDTEVCRQLVTSGYQAFLLEYRCFEKHVRGKFNVLALETLRRDPRLRSGLLHQLHADVGPDRVEFRSLRNQYGKGSLQMVIGAQTGLFYADVDGWNPYEDVVNFGGHALFEVLPHWWLNLWA